jgi:hypothetical protein
LPFAKYFFRSIEVANLADGSNRQTFHVFAYDTLLELDMPRAVAVDSEAGVLH